MFGRISFCHVKKTAKWGRRKSAPYALLCQSRHVFNAISTVVCMKNYLIGIDTNEIYLVVPKKVFNYLMFSIINNSNFRYFYEV